MDNKSNYDVFVDILWPYILTIIPIVTGMIIEDKFKVLYKIKNYFSLNNSQSGHDNVSQVSGRDSHHAPTVIKGPTFGKQTVNLPTPTTPNAANPEDALKPPEFNAQSMLSGSNTEYVIEKLSTHSSKFGTPYAFSETLMDIYSEWRANENPGTASAQYFSLFKGMISNLTDTGRYQPHPGLDKAIDKVHETFTELENYMNSNSVNNRNLEVIIIGYERSLVALLAYI